MVTLSTKLNALISVGPISLGVPLPWRQKGATAPPASQSLTQGKPISGLKGM